MTNTKKIYTKYYSSYGVNVSTHDVANETSQYVTTTFGNKFNKKTGKKVGANGPSYANHQLITEEEFKQIKADRANRQVAVLLQRAEGLKRELQEKLAEIDSQISNIRKLAA